VNMQKKKTEVNQRDIENSLLISQRIEIEDVRLVRLNCYHTPEAYSEDKKEFGIERDTTCNMDKEEGMIFVFAKFNFQGYNQGKKKTEDACVRIDCEYVLAYSVEDFEGITEAGCNEFARINGIFNAWPYWRELVQNTIARMGLPQLTLPVFRIEAEREQR